MKTIYKKLLLMIVLTALSNFCIKKFVESIFPEDEPVSVDPS